MQIAGVIAQCQASLAAEQFDQAWNLARILETEHPQSQEEWRALYEVFIQVKDYPWAEIMTVRFLKTCPNNISALIAECHRMSNLPEKNKSQEMKDMIENIESVGLKSSEEYFKMAIVHQRLSKGQKAALYFEAAELLDPGNTDILISALRNLVEIGKFHRARKRLRELYQVYDCNIDVLTSIMNLSWRIRDYKLTADVITRIIGIVGDGAHLLKTWLATRSADIERCDLLLKVWPMTDLSKVYNVASLITFYRSIAGRGQVEIEWKIIARIRSLDPENEDLRTMNEPNRQRFIDKFYRSSALPAMPYPTPSNSSSNPSK